MSEESPKVGVGVMVRRGNQVLFGRRVDSGQWCLPGGMVEFGETVLAAAARELKEETGLVAKNLVESVWSEQVCVEPGSHRISILVMGEWGGGDAEVCEPTKCHEWRWFDRTQLPADICIASADVLERLEK